MIPGRPRCSGESREREEELFASASLVSNWILFEQPGAWGPDALTDSAFPTSARPLVDTANRLGIRILLIRRRTGDDHPPVAFLAGSGDGRRPPWMVSSEYGDPAELTGIDLEGWAEGGIPDFGRPFDGPIYLVCTHGRHDICCADRGRPLFRAMSELRPDQTWEVSHIGGDRFAGNLLVLPRGDYFGRLEPEDAANLVEEYEATRLDLAHHRGWSIHPRLVQAADHFLRQSLSLAAFEDLTLLDYDRLDHDHAEVSFRGRDQVVHRVQVVARTLPDQVFLTCRAGEPGQPVAYDLLSIESA